MSTEIQAKILGYLKEHKTATREELREACGTRTKYTDYRWAEMALIDAGLITNHNEMRQTKHNGRCLWIGFKITEKGEADI